MQISFLRNSCSCNTTINICLQFVFIVWCRSSNVLFCSRLEKFCLVKFGSRHWKLEHNQTLVRLNELLHNFTLWIGWRSHTKTMAPHTMRSSCFRKPILFTRQAMPIRLMLNRNFLPLGEIGNAPRKLRRSWWSILVRITNVYSCRAQVRLSGETKEKPASFSSAGVAFRARTFINHWQTFLLPIGHRYIVSV